MLIKTFLLMFFVGVFVGFILLSAQFLYDMNRNKDAWSLKVRFSYAWSNIAALAPVAIFAILLWAMASFGLASALVKAVAADEVVEELSSEWPELNNGGLDGVNGLNDRGLCGGGGASDHFTWGALARWGMGLSAPGRPPKQTKMHIRFSYKTYFALITSDLCLLNRHRCQMCRFQPGLKALAVGEIGSLYVYTNKRSYV